MRQRAQAGADDAPTGSSHSPLAQQAGAPANLRGSGVGKPRMRRVNVPLRTIPSMHSCACNFDGPNQALQRAHGDVGGAVAGAALGVAAEGPGVAAARLLALLAAVRRAVHHLGRRVAVDIKHDRVARHVLLRAWATQCAPSATFRSAHGAHSAHISHGLLSAWGKQCTHQPRFAVRMAHTVCLSVPAA